MSFKNMSDERAENKGEEYVEQIQFRELNTILNKILSDRKIKPRKIPLYIPEKMKNTVCNVVEPDIIILIQFIKPKNRYLINSTIGIAGEYHYNELMNRLIIARRNSYGY